jgi:hypothetical protein
MLSEDGVNKESMGSIHTRFDYGGSATQKVRWQRGGEEQKKTATLHPVRAGEAVSQLAFEQMIYFVADGMKIIQA